MHPPGSILLAAERIGIVDSSQSCSRLRRRRSAILRSTFSVGRRAITSLLRSVSVVMMLSPSSSERNSSSSKLSSSSVSNGGIGSASIASGKSVRARPSRHETDDRALAIFGISVRLTSSSARVSFTLFTTCDLVCVCVHLGLAAATAATQTSELRSILADRDRPCTHGAFQILAVAWSPSAVSQMRSHAPSRGSAMMTASESVATSRTESQGVHRYRVRLLLRGRTRLLR